MKFLFNSVHYLYNYYMVCALLSHNPHVMSPDCDLWHLVIWYFLTLSLCSKSRKEKIKKRNIDIDLAIEEAICTRGFSVFFWFKFPNYCLDSSEYESFNK